MATLCLDAGFEASCRRDVPEWITNGRGLLFSHPEDFRPLRYQSGRDAAFKYELSRRAVRPIAVQRDGAPIPSWVGDLDSSDISLRLPEPPFAAGDAISLGVRALRSILLAHATRFVVLVDDTLRQSRLYSYESWRRSRSDLLDWIDRMTGASVIAQAA